MNTKEHRPFPKTPGTTWAETWIKRKRDHLRSLDIGHEGDFWMQPDNVRRYLKNVRGPYGQVVIEQLRTMSIPPNAKVLDIGSGPGTLAVPLAMKGCTTTVVEQAPLMCEACEEYRCAEGAEPITIINKRWEDVNPSELSGPFDLVISSYALTMIDLAESIRKIKTVTSGRVYIFWFLTPPSWAEVMRDLWFPLHGKLYESTPLADCLWNVLYEMGIYANLEVMDPAPHHRYDSAEQAAEQFYGRLVCTEEWQREQVLNYFKQRLIHSGEGNYLFGGGSRNAIVWWDFNDQ